MGNTLTEDEKLPKGSTADIPEQTLLIHLWSNGHNIPLTDLPGLDPLNKGYNQ